MRRLFVGIALVAANLLVPIGGALHQARGQVSGLMWPTQSVADVLQYATPSSGATVAMQTGISALVINNGALLATLTVQLPVSPLDGQRVIVASGAGVTLLTVDGGSITVKGTIASLAINGYARYIYSASANAWFRSG